MNELKRNCPQCQDEIIYKSKGGHYTACKNNSVCRKCASINSGFTERYATIGASTGDKNPFYGKHHTEASKKKIHENRDYTAYRTPERKARISECSSGKNNPMYGKTFYQVWIEKYGQEEADRRLELKRKKNSESSTGKNNPMYGKPSPKKAGNGWCGWYKNWFFRSLRELSYVIDVLEKNHLGWKSCEGLIRIEYKDWNGTDRTYSPDFLVGNSLIEIKPIKLHESINVLYKKRAAEKYCLENGYKYFLTDCDILQFSTLHSLIDAGLIILTNKTKDRLIEYEKTLPTKRLSGVGQKF